MKNWIILALPELTLSAAAVLLFAVDAFSGKRVKVYSLGIAAAALLAAFVMALSSPFGGRSFGMLVHDDFASFFKLLAILSAFLILLLSEKDEFLLGPNAGSYAGLILLSTAGTLFLSSAEDLLILFVGLELTTIPLFVLAGYLRKERKSTEGAIKFFLVGAFSTGLMIYGMSFLYGITGSTHFSRIREWVLLASSQGADLTLFLVGIFFLLAGLSFKMSLVPFHQWTPDAYEGAPTPVTAFFSVSRDAGVIAVLLRFFSGVVDQNLVGLNFLFVMFSVLTMTVGNLTALRQTSLKRLLAYSSIAHAGAIFIGLVAGNEMGRQGVMLYSLAYSLMSIGAFAVVVIVSRAKGSDDISSFQGLAKDHLGLAILMVFFLMSLAGIPPLLGFLGKFYVFMAAVQAKMYWLVAIGLGNALIAVYYYFRIVHRMFFMEPIGGKVETRHEVGAQAAVLSSAFILLALGIFPETILSWISSNFHFLP